MHPLLWVTSVLVATVVVVTEGRVTGWHSDIEACSGLVQNNKTEQTIVCHKFFEQMYNLSLAVGNASKQIPGPPLTLSLDTGTGWVCPAGSSPDLCFNLTWHGETKSVAEHVMDIADETVIMDYDHDPSKLLQRAAPFLAYLDGLGKPLSVGVAIVAPGEQPQWWQTANEKALLALMNDVWPTLHKHSCVEGFSVFTSAAWLNQSHVAPVPGDLSWPAKNSLWYLDSELVTDVTKRDVFVTWALKHNIHRIYMSPHKLLPASAEQFCDFIKLTDGKGIDIQLYSSPAADLPFLLNCLG